MAREALTRYTRGADRSVSAYFKALHHFENTLFQIKLSLGLLKELSGERMYKAGERGVLERLSSLRNHVEHVESRIREGVLESNQNIAVWLTNDGLLSVDVGVAYAEIADVIVGMTSFMAKIEKRWGTAGP